MSTTSSHTDLLTLAEHVARQAGDVLLDYHRRMRSGGDIGIGTKSSATDPVSAADRHSETVLVQAITTSRPDDGLLGEEGARRSGSTGLRWVVDPLDGTVNYLYGHTGWSVSVAVEQQSSNGDWSAVAGVVFEPLTGDLFAATCGGGATCNGETLRVNDPVPLEMALVGTGFSYDRAHRIHQAAIAARLLGCVRDLRRVGSAALDLCRVAQGAVDAYYEDSTQRWDWAAGVLIAAEAGAIVTPLDTMPGHSGVIAAGSAVHPELQALIQEFAGG